MPEIEEKKPEALKEFDKYNVKGINVYVHKKVHTKEGIIRLSLSRFLFLKSIEVSGVTIL